MYNISKSYNIAAHPHLTHICNDEHSQRVDTVLSVTVAFSF